MKPLVPTRTLYFNLNGYKGQCITLCYKKPKILKKKFKTVVIKEETRVERGEKVLE